MQSAIDESLFVDDASMPPYGVVSVHFDFSAPSDANNLVNVEVCDWHSSLLVFVVY
jgi:hypothetical protein